MDGGQEEGEVTGRGSTELELVRKDMTTTTRKSVLQLDESSIPGRARSKGDTPSEGNDVGAGEFFVGHGGIWLGDGNARDRDGWEGMWS